MRVALTVLAVFALVGAAALAVAQRDPLASLDAAADRVMEQAIEEADSHATSSRERSALGFRAYVRFVEADPVGFRLLFSSATRQDKEWAAISNDVQRAIAEGIAERIKVTGVDDAHRMVLAHGIMGLAEGMMRYWHSGAVDDSVAFDDLLTDLQALAWGGIRNIGT